jgi:hypothetical protein
MSIYRVCTLFMRFGAPGRGGVAVRCVEEEGWAWWNGRWGRTLCSFDSGLLVVALRAGAL